MNNQEIRLASNVLFTVLELLRMYQQQGFDVSKDIKEARLKLEEIDNELLRKNNLSDYRGEQ